MDIGTLQTIYDFYTLSDFPEGFETSSLYIAIAFYIWVKELPGYGRTEREVLVALSDGKPRSLMDLAKQTGLTSKRIGSALYRLWNKGAILRTEKPTYEALRAFKARAGIKKNTRAYHLYMFVPEKDSVSLQGTRFVKYDKKLEKRGVESKAEIIRRFIEENADRAFYSTEIVEILKDRGIEQRDIMSTVRRAEDKGLVYVRGYRTHDDQTPFKEGYIITWIDPSKPREQALEEAVQRTEKALAHKSSTSPIIERIHQIRDVIIESTKLRDLVSFEFIQNRLGCTQYEAEGALERALQLYPELKEVKMFNNFRYYYHASMPEDDLKAAISMKENYIRVAKGRMNRMGHNWEACVEWFIDKFTTGASFKTQDHRGERMDPRRITVHLVRSVAGRKYNAEVDRVWEVTPGVFAQPITYVLECKWGLVTKRNVDDFLDILRWSKDFGVDTPEGRQVKQGIVGVFAGSAFDPKESVRLKDETIISLASYASRMNIQLLKAADFNEKLRERGMPKEVTVQKICRISKDEKEVREVLEEIWKGPEKSEGILNKVMENNRETYEFEKMLEETAQANS